MAQTALVYAPVHDDLVHEICNGLAGMHGAVQIVHDRLPSGVEREILSRVISRMEELSKWVHEAKPCS
jgi:nitrogen-specific signal transduction histidine kinase